MKDIWYLIYIKAAKTSFFMGEAKRRKELGVPLRKINSVPNLPEVNKEAIQKKVRSTLYKYPIISFLFYGASLLIIIGGVIYLVKYYKLI